MNQVPVCMAEEYWINSHFSIARHYGGMRVKNEGKLVEYKIVNKHGHTLWELSDPASPHYVGDGDTKAIPPGEPADLIREDFIPYYKALGREAFIEVLKSLPPMKADQLKEEFIKRTKKEKP